MHVDFPIFQIISGHFVPLSQKCSCELAVLHGFFPFKSFKKRLVCRALTNPLKRGLQKLAPYAIISTTAKERRKNWMRRRTVTNMPMRSARAVQGG